MISVSLRSGSQLTIPEAAFARVEGEWLVCYASDGHVVTSFPQLSVTACQINGKRELELDEPEPPHRRRRRGHHRG